MGLLGNRGFQRSTNASIHQARYRKCVAKIRTKEGRSYPSVMLSERQEAEGAWSVIEQTGKRAAKMSKSKVLLWRMTAMLLTVGSREMSSNWSHGDTPWAAHGEGTMQRSSVLCTRVAPGQLGWNLSPWTTRWVELLYVIYSQGTDNGSRKGEFQLPL